MSWVCGHGSPGGAGALLIQAVMQRLVEPIDTRIGEPDVLRRQRATRAATRGVRGSAPSTIPPRSCGQRLAAFYASPRRWTPSPSGCLATGHVDAASTARNWVVLNVTRPTARMSSSTSASQRNERRRRSSNSAPRRRRHPPPADPPSSGSSTGDAVYKGVGWTLGAVAGGTSSSSRSACAWRLRGWRTKLPLSCPL